ncbi:MAG TPA: chromate efflux transporter [Candidatus Krumholzibacteria bacterium]|nr:chromate efflux transporter [Candidatus Krumholzibacteria bacterium]
MRQENASEPVRIAEVPFGVALRFWVKLGFISFGGPAGQIAILHREVVERRRWISENQFLHALNYCMLLPGPEAQQLATYIGWLLHRARGGLAAGILFVLPSVLILLALSIGYAVYGESPLAAGCLAGFKSVVVAIVAAAVLRIGRRALRSKAHLFVAIGAFVGIYFLHVPFPLIVLAAAVFGLIGTRLWPATWTVRSAQPHAPAGPTAIDLADTVDVTTPAHTLPSRSRALRILAAGILLWTVPYVALSLWFGGGSVLLQQYRFFTGAAFVTFGGAYAVLAYVTQAAVHGFGWITSAQAIDGLALAETTPGPLIMVLQFVGFMTGWNNPDGLDRMTAATLGALITTWTTFLPCFLFVFIGAPYIETLRDKKSFNGALSGVTAAVIGVILNLALVFGAAVIVPRNGGVHWFEAGLAVLAWLAMSRFRIDALWIVVAGGLAGLVRTLVLA